LNPACPFVHTDGQKRGKFEDKVWTANTGEGFDREAAEKLHTSERKFVADDTVEELVLPGQGQIDGGSIGE